LYIKVKETCAQERRDIDMMTTLSDTCEWMIEAYVLISMHVASRLHSLVQEKKM